MSRVVLNTAEINRLLYDRSGPVVSEVWRIGREVQARARRYVPVDRGMLRSSITLNVDVSPARQEVVATVGSALPYAIFQELGTGLYGPRRQVIRPRRAGGVLVFRPRGAGRTVFARHVRGTPPKHFLTRALRDVSPWPIRPGR